MKELKNFPEQRWHSKYPWSKYADGKPRLAEHGKDFSSRDSFSVCGWKWATTHGCIWRQRIVGKDLAFALTPKGGKK